MPGRPGSVVGVPKFLAQEAITPAPAAAPAQTVPGAVYFSTSRAPPRRRDDQPLGSPPAPAPTPAQAVPRAGYFSTQRAAAARRRDDPLGSPAALTAGIASQALTATPYTDNDASFAPGLAQQAVVAGAAYFSARRAPPQRRDDLLGAPLSLLAAIPQALAAALYVDSSEAIFAPAITAGAVGLAASLYTDTDTVFAPALVPGTVDLTVSLYTDADTLFAPSLAAIYGLTAALYTDNDGYFTHGLTSQYDLAAALYSDPDAFFAAALSAGAVDLAPSLYTDVDALFSPDLSAAGSLVADLYTEPDAFYPATLAAAGVVPGAVYFSAALPLPYRLRFDLFGSPPSLLAGSTQTLQVAIHADIDSYFGAALTGGVQPPVRIGTTTRFMVNLGTMTSRQH